jgi:hypothetical protein
MHANCPTKFIHDFICHGEERKPKMSYYNTPGTFPLLSLPQVQMFFERPFTSCARHVGEKGLLYQGKDLLKKRPEHKKQ